MIQYVEAPNLLYVDPEELMQHNPAALIVNTVSYRRIEAHFAHDQFEPPQAVRVATFSALGAEVIRLFVVDGHTRTKYFSDHKDQTLPGHPGYFDKIPVRDVTDSEIENPLTVTAVERQATKERGALSVEQYLRAVVPPTIKHSQIAPDRIAAHLINGWNHMIGVDLSDRYSALAALSFLENRRVPTATEDMLNKFLVAQPVLMVGETLQERQRLHQALLGIMSIIRQSRLFKERIVSSAFALVSTEAQVIGGEKEARRQIYGLLHTPEIDSRLAEQFSELGPREPERLRLGQLIFETMKRFADRPDKEQILNTLGLIIGNVNLSLQDIEHIFNSNDPRVEYDNLRQLRNIGVVRDAYERSKKGTLTDKEVTLVGNLGKRTYLDDSEIPAIVRMIHNAETALMTADNSLKVLAEGDLSRLGVNPQTLTTSIEAITKARATVLAATSSQTMSLRLSKLKYIITQTEQEIVREKWIFRVGNLINEIYGTELTIGYGTHIKSGLLAYVIGQEDLSDEAIVRMRLNQIRKLDQDLQARIITGRIRLPAALRIQDERRSGIPVSHPIPPVAILPVVSIQEQAVASPMVTESDRVNAEQYRKQVNEADLIQGLGVLKELFAEVDLDAADLTEQGKKELDLILRWIGRIRFDHPDIVRVLEEDYPRLLRERVRALETRVNQEQEGVTRATKTGI